MLILNPDSVTFDSATLSDVTAIAIDRTTERDTVEWSDRGPHAVFADVPQQRTTIKIRRALTRPELDGPRPTDYGLLTVRASATASHAGRRELRASCVVTRITHDVSRSGATQTLELIAVSPTGDTDPITLLDLES